MAAQESTPSASATLACRLTPPGEGGISIVELYGPKAAETLGRLFVNPRGITVGQIFSGRLVYGYLQHGGEILDEVVVECIEQPERFAVNCHGGELAFQRVMRALTAEGAIQVGGGQFLEVLEKTGRLSSIRREAAELIPRAPTLRAASALLSQYCGALEQALDSLRQAAACAGIPEWPQIECSLANLLLTARYGRGLTEPPRLVICGRPNVGKSTLANALLRFDRMIVHPQPGTTRDTIEELFSARGLPFLMVDTAGIRQTESSIEREGVQRGLAELARADIALLVFDASAQLEPEDLQLMAGPLPAKRVAALNKSDLGRVLRSDEIMMKLMVEPVYVSARTGEGIEELEERIIRAVYPITPLPGQPILFTERQERIAREALEAARKRNVQRLLERLHEF